jgi:3-oxoacyl-[acyl-carrier protein] reductase
MTLDGQVAIVTGASRGLGAAIAKALAHEKAAVVVNYWESEEKAKEVVRGITGQGGRAILLKADVRDWDEVKSMAEKAESHFGKVDILVNSALYHYSFDPVRRKTFETIIWQDYQDQLDGTLKGAFHCCKALVPGMIKRKRGKIINILSNLVNNPVVAYHDYTTAKAAMVGFSRNLAAELGPQGIRVNMIAPGLTLPTDAAKATTEEVKALVASITPLRKVGSVEEVARVVALFASPDMDWVTGSYTTADGGLVMY